MALSHCMPVALAYHFEFKQYSNRLIIHQLCDFNMAPHAASHLSCYLNFILYACRNRKTEMYRERGEGKCCQRIRSPYTIRDEYEMFRDTMMGFLLHIQPCLSMLFAVERLSHSKRQGSSVCSWQKKFNFAK